jgi:hypothetical protein
LASDADFGESEKEGEWTRQPNPDQPPVVVGDAPLDDPDFIREIEAE